MQNNFPIFLSVHIKKLLLSFDSFKTNIHSFYKELILFGLEISSLNQYMKLITINV